MSKKMNVFIENIRRKWLRLRYQPIEVFCIHHISDVYNPLTMWECDWMQTEQFKRSILSLKQEGYKFISLTEAYNKLKSDWIRKEKYAVLTADDGYRSILSILPWLENQNIPITLFINTKYLDGKSWSSINEEQARRVKPDVDMLNEVCPDLYISQEELFELTSPLISIGMHGHEHLDATKQTLDEFKKNIELCRNILQKHPRYISFMAYTWGRHNREEDKLLKDKCIIPLLMNGRPNFNKANIIERTAIDRIAKL